MSTTFTENQINRMIALAKDGASFQDIADAFRLQRKVVYNAFAKRKLTVNGLQWADDGWRGKLLVQLHREGLPIDTMASKLKCNHRTVRAQMEARGLKSKQTYIRNPPPPTMGRSKGKGRKQERVAAAIYAPPQIVPEHAMGIERTPWPSGCCHVTNDVSDWQQAHYCNQEVVKVGKLSMFCPAHNPLRPKEQTA